MAGLPERTVEVRGEKYTFRLVPAMTAFTELRKLASKAGSLLPDLASQDKSNFKNNLSELILDDVDHLIDVFIDKNQLQVNGKLLGGENEFNEHFAGKAIAIGELLYKVILENDKDFFHSLPSWIGKGLKLLNTKLQANSLPKLNEDKIMEAVNNLAGQAG